VCGGGGENKNEILFKMKLPTASEKSGSRVFNMGGNGEYSSKLVARDSLDLKKKLKKIL